MMAVAVDRGWFGIVLERNSTGKFKFSYARQLRHNSSINSKINFNSPDPKVRFYVPPPFAKHLASTLDHHFLSTTQKFAR